jgi:hypothetical protein
MATGGYINNGVKIAYSSSSPVSWQQVGQVLSAPQMGIERDKVDSTVHSAYIYKRSLPGMAEIPPLEMMLLADLNQATSPGQDALRSLCVNGTTVYWRIEVPVDRTQTLFRAFEFQAYVRSWLVNSETPEDRQEVSCTLEFDDTTWTVYNAAASAIS